jgi:hypothetical protein
VESLKTGFNKICSSVSLFVSICATLCITFGEEGECMQGFVGKARRKEIIRKT